MTARERAQDILSDGAGVLHEQIAQEKLEAFDRAGLAIIDARELERLRRLDATVKAFTNRMVKDALIVAVGHRAARKEGK